MSNNIPNQKLTVYLMKSGTREFKGYIEDKADVISIPLLESIPYESELFVSRSKENPPRWKNFLELGTLNPLSLRDNISNSAILFIRRSNRVFAFTFGHGLSRLRIGKIERYFGLRVAVNVVNSETVTSLDTKTVDEITTLRRTQKSKASDLADYGLLENEDMLGQLIGHSKDDEFAKIIHGADSLQISVPIELKDLGIKCSEFLKYYKSQEYKKTAFRDIDSYRILRDSEIIERVGDKVVARLIAGDIGNMHFSPPTITDQNIQSYGFSPKGEEHSELELTDFISSIRSIATLSYKNLSSRYVYVKYDTELEFVKKWRVFDVLVAEITENDRTYILSGGEWFEIDKKFTDKVDRRLSKYKKCSINFPNSPEGQDEETYNLNSANSKLICLDRKCVKVDGNSIEFCDLFSADKKIIHVKRWKSSSSLSHLFTQATVSAETMLNDEDFRKDVRAAMKSVNTRYGTKVSITRPNPDDFEVVYAIIKGGKNGWNKKLPFLSRLALLRSMDSVSRLGYKVTIAKISAK